MVSFNEYVNVQKLGLLNEYTAQLFIRFPPPLRNVAQYHSWSESDNITLERAKKLEVCSCRETTFALSLF